MHYREQHRWVSSQQSPKLAMELDRQEMAPLGTQRNQHVERWVRGREKRATLTQETGRSY